MRFHVDSGGEALVCRVRMLWLVVAATIAGVLPAEAVCPNSIPDCLGAATGFKIVADKVNIGRGLIGSEGFVSVLGSDVGDTCAGRGVISGPSCDRSVVSNVVLTASDGIAATFRGFPCPFDGTPAGIGADIASDLVTGGGQLRAEYAVNVMGNTDTSGADPRVTTCAQARADMRSAWTQLDALAPTRNLGRIIAAPENGMTSSIFIDADPGVNVWTATGITAISRKNGFSGEIHESHVIIRLDPATESVVIKTPSVRVQRYSSVAVDGDPTKVVILLPAGGSVRNKSGAVEPWIVGPDGSMSVKTNGESDRGPVGALAGRVSVLGGAVY